MTSHLPRSHSMFLSTKEKIPRDKYSRTFNWQLRTGTSFKTYWRWHESCPFTSQESIYCQVRFNIQHWHKPSKIQTSKKLKIINSLKFTRKKRKNKNHQKIIPKLPTKYYFHIKIYSIYIIPNLLLTQLGEKCFRIQTISTRHYTPATFFQ